MATSSPRARFLTPAEVADQLRVSTMTVYRLIKSGELRAARIGKSYRHPRGRRRRATSRPASATPGRRLAGTAPVASPGPWPPASTRSPSSPTTAPPTSSSASCKSVIRSIAPARHGHRPHPRDPAPTTCAPASLTLGRARAVPLPRAWCSRSSTPASAPSAGRVAVEVGDGAELLVGPDNGLLARAVAMSGGATAAVELTNAELPPARARARPSPAATSSPPPPPTCATGVALAELGAGRSTRSSLLPGLLPAHPRGGRRARRRGAVGRPLRQLPAQRRPRRGRPARRPRAAAVGRRRPHRRAGRHLRRASRPARSAWSSTATGCSRSCLGQRSAADELGMRVGTEVTLRRPTTTTRADRTRSPSPSPPGGRP